MRKLIVFAVLLLCPAVVHAAWVVNKDTKYDANGDARFVFTYVKDGTLKKTETIPFDPSLTATDLKVHTFTIIAALDALDALQVAIPDGKVTPVAPSAQDPAVPPALQAFIAEVKDWKDKEALLASGASKTLQQSDVDTAHALAKADLGNHPEYINVWNQILKQYD